MIITKEQFKDALDTAYRAGYAECSYLLPEDVAADPPPIDVEMAVEGIYQLVEHWIGTSA